MAEKVRIPLGVPLVTGLLAALKLTGVVDWSWVWVFAPMWLPWVVMGVLAVATIIVYKVRSRRAY
jgi:hypothetical protein